MKVKIDIDCTPAEAREFLGLPDIRDVQKTFLEVSEKRFMEHAEQIDMKNIMDVWMPKGSFDPAQFQNLWSNFGTPPDKDDNRS